MSLPSTNPVLIIKTGDTYPEIGAHFGDFDRWFIPFFQAQGLSTRTLEVHRGVPLPPLGQVRAVLITGSPAMVSHREPWSEATAGWLRDYVATGRFTLGVCYGHQLLAHAFGGRVEDHPDGREIGTLPVQLNDTGKADPLLGGLPAVFAAHLTHRQSVLKLPSSAELLASSTHESHQSFRIGSCCWGVQFHPEFTPSIMSAYLDRHRPQLEKEGVDTEALYRNAKAGAPEAARVLERFAQMVANQ